MDTQKLMDIVSHFDTDGTPQTVTPLGNGLINDTFKVTTREGGTDYVLQRINNSIFTDVDMLQDNIMKATAHIRRKLEEKGVDDIDRRVVTLVTAGGKPYYTDGDTYWRMLVFIRDSYTYESVTPQYAYCTGLAFGDFQLMLSDIPCEIGEIIRDFHNMEFRLRQLDESIAADKAGRLDKVACFTEQVRAEGDRMCFGEKLYREGRLPKRICHCDTKVNNILFDKDGQVLCVIDLDTVMPNFVFSDYGEFLRYAANNGAEDDSNLANITFNREIFSAFTRGYLEAASPFLTETEIEYLPYAMPLFAYMTAVRFLADYLNGDTYYKTLYPEHNIVRAHAQFRLYQVAMDNVEYMKQEIERIRQEIKQK